ncbi:MAG TPA: response regulator transcription factor [Actinomycetota bacterium]|nr:response regulator transcription factor [Actinomycetota bacterium]
MAKLRLMVVDDHDVVRMGLRALIESEDEFELVAEASSGPEAVSQAAKYDPDVVILDVRMPEGGGIEACREIRDHNPDIRILMLTSFSDDEALFNSIMAGASGYLLKGVNSQELVRSIRSLAKGNALLDPAVTLSVLERVRVSRFDASDPKLRRLNAQEDRVLALVAKGLTNRQIGEELKISDKTVKNYVSGILRKLEVVRRSEAAAYLSRAQAQEKRPE